MFHELSYYLHPLPLRVTIASVVLPIGNAKIVTSSGANWFQQVEEEGLLSRRNSYRGRKKLNVPQTIVNGGHPDRLTVITVRVAPRLAVYALLH